MLEQIFKCECVCHSWYHGLYEGCDFELNAGKTEYEGFCCVLRNMDGENMKYI